MKIAIWGAGGIGCYYGAKLQTAGHEVVFIARGKHLTAMQSEGLSVSHPEFSFHETVCAIDQDELLEHYLCQQFDLIILALKNTHTASLLEAASEWLKQGETPVLSLQNGVDNEPEIAQCIGEERTLGGLAVRIGGHIIEPGCVEATGIAQVIFGAWPNHHNNVAQPENQKQGDSTEIRDNSAQLKSVNTFNEMFQQAGIASILTDDIQRELWRKLIINNGVNPLSALSGLDTRSLTQNPVLRDKVYSMMLETAAAAEHDGLILERTDVDEMFELICNFDAIKTSMLVDKEKGRPLELDGISGTVLRRCQQLGIEAPVTAFVHEILSLEEERRHG